MQDAILANKLAAAGRVDTACFAKIWRKDIDPAAHQFEMAQRFDDSKVLYQFDAWPRDHGKSEIFVISGPLRTICENPNARILIVQKTEREAMKSLGVIKMELETNYALKSYYAKHWWQETGYTDICNLGGKITGTRGRKLGAWQQKMIYVKRSRMSKDPSIEAVGVLGTITGGHVDLIVLDDVEDDESTRTDTRLRALTEWFSGTIMQLREPDTKIVVVGTLKTPGADIYNLVQENPMWSCKVVPAILSHELGDIEYDVGLNEEGGIESVNVTTPDVEVLWPEKWPIVELVKDYLASLVRSIWIREKMNDLRAMSGKILKREWFKYYNLADMPETFDFIIQIWDTAFLTKASADWSACLTGGVYKGSFYVLDVFRKRLEFPGLVQEVQDRYAIWRPNRLYVENKASGISLIQMIRTETTFPIMEAKPGRESKEQRANSVTVYFESGRVLFPEVAPWLDVFEDQLVMFPNVAHDDMMDCMVYGLIYGMLRRMGRSVYGGLVEDAVKKEAQALPEMLVRHRFGI